MRAQIIFHIDAVDYEGLPQAVTDLPGVARVGDKYYGSMLVDDAVFERQETRAGAPGKVKDVYIRLGDAVWDQNSPQELGSGYEEETNTWNPNVFGGIRSGCYFAYDRVGENGCNEEELLQFDGTYSDIWGFDFAGNSKKVNGLYGGVMDLSDSLPVDIYGDRFGAIVFAIGPLDLVVDSSECPGAWHCGMNYPAAYGYGVGGRIQVRIPEPSTVALFGLALFGLGLSLRARAQ
ncbi:hypothetical protein GCM10023089_07090 [Quisquiliibacterium transsilvanicum]